MSHKRSKAARKAVPQARFDPKVMGALVPGPLTAQQEPMYPMVFFDALRVKIRDEGVVANRAVYVALGTVFPRPIWGPGHDIGKFGTAKGLFEYLQMLMPFDDPAKLDDRQKTAVTAYMLVRNGTLPADATLPVGGNATPIR